MMSPARSVLDETQPMGSSPLSQVGNRSLSAPSCMTEVRETKFSMSVPWSMPSPARVIASAVAVDVVVDTGLAAP